MQQRYLEQFHELYEDFHIVKMPLLEDEVRGVDALRAFSANLLSPYVPDGSEAELQQTVHLEQEIAAWKARCEELEIQLAAKSQSA